MKAVPTQPTLNKFNRLLKLVLFVYFATTIFKSTAQTQETIPVGSFIIDMGAVTPTIANSLKPYGLVYDLLKNNYVPVKRSINQSKSKDGIDFTHNGKSYSGGPFVISSIYRSTAVDKVIYSWRAQGVIIDSTIASISLPIAFTATTPPRWAMDAQNGYIAIAYLNEAGIPATAFSYRTPNALNNCDDIFVMPHADPTWANHRNLYFWNKNSKGTIWAGCHAPSVMESIFKDTVIAGSSVRLKMNFLSTNGLLMYSSHVHPTPPYVHQHPTDVMTQYMGVSDPAQIKGSEQVFMPSLGSVWNTDAKVITYANGQPEIPTKTPGQAAVNIFGRGFGNANNGWVMYQGGHDFSSTKLLATDGQKIAAKKMFFNFSIFALAEKMSSTFTAVISGIPTQLKALTTYNGLTVSASGSGSLTYRWISSVPGTFSNSTGTSTSFTPAEVAQTTNCMITCLVTDPCGRTIFDSKGGIILVPSVAALSAKPITKSLPSGCTSSTTQFNVFDSNIDSTAGNRTLTAASGFTHGTVSFTSNGDITYTSTANYVGNDVGTYTISDGTSNANSSLTIQVGSLASYPLLSADNASVIEDNVSVINVIANDKNTPSAANSSQLFVRNIIKKPSKGFVYINNDGTVSYLSRKDAASGIGQDSFTYQACNAAGFCSEGVVRVTILKDGCAAGQYQTGINIPTVTKLDTIYASLDTYIAANNTSTNYGTATSFKLVSRTSRNLRALLKFDLSGYASSQTITSATLFLTSSASYTYNATNGPFPAAITKSLRPWVETQATWTKFNSSTNWGTAGSANATTDYTLTDSATLVRTSNMSVGTLISSNVTSMVQSWINSPSNNNGMLIIPRASTTSTTLTANFYSRNYSTNLFLRPKLAISYSILGASFPCAAIPTNYKPVGYSDTVSTFSNALVNISVLANDVNYYGNTNNIQSVSANSWKGATVSFSGSVVTYTPSGSFIGVDTFTYVLRDAVNNQTTTVSVFVNVKRVAPVVNADRVTTPSGTPININISGNDSDPQGPLSTPTFNVQPKSGTITSVGNNILYTPTAGYVGKDTMVYIRYGSTSSSCETAMFDTALVVVTVANQAPVAKSDTINTTSCAPVSLALKNNDTDAEGTPLTINVISNPTHGTLSIVSGGQYTYVSANNYIGTDQFTYNVKDGSADSLTSNTATVYITVLPSSPTNSAPVAVIDRDFTFIEQQLIVDVKANDYDAENNTTTVSILSSGLLLPANGTLTLFANGSISYMPNTGFIGVDSFEYKLCDSNINCSGTSSLCSFGKVIVTVRRYPIRLSGKVWEDVDNSALNSFNTINTGAEVGSNTNSALKVYLLDTLNNVLDYSPVDFNGSYSLFNTSPITKQKLWVSSTSFNVDDNIPSNKVLAGELPYTFSYTTPASRLITTGLKDTVGFDFGVNQFPSPTPYVFPLIMNPNTTIVVDSSKIKGTDGGNGFVTQIRYLYFPSQTQVFTINGVNYTNANWPTNGVTVNKNSPIRLLPNTGSVTCNIIFKVIDNGGAISVDSNIVSIPLYKVLAAGTVSGSGTYCGSGLPTGITSVTNADGGRDAINYQWQSSSVANFSSGVVDIANAIGASFSPSTIINTTTYFRREAYTSIDSPAYSNILTYTIQALPTVPTVTNASRTGSGTVTLSAVPPTGSVIDWYQNSVGGSSIATATNTYTTPSIANTTIYYAVSRNTTTSCLSARVPVTATVTGTINPGSIGNAQVLCGDGVPDSITSISPASGVTGFAYQWQESIDSLTWVDNLIDTSVNSDMYFPENEITQTTWYRRAASKSGLTTTYTNAIKVAISALPDTPSVVGNARTGQGVLTLTATAGNNETIDWYDAASNGVLLSSGSMSYSTPIINTTTTYYAVARNIYTGCQSIVSVPVTATINDDLDAGLISGYAEVCGSGIPPAITSVQPASNGTGNISYVWQISTTSAISGFSDLLGQTGLNYTPGLISVTSYFRRKAFTSNDAAVFSNVIAVIVNPLPTLIVSPSNTSIVTGSSVTFTASGANRYSWSNGDTLANTTVSPVALGTYTYTVTGTDGNGCVNTASASVTVNPQPSVGGTAVTSLNTLCAGSSATITLSGHTGTVSWQTSSNGTTWSDTTVTGITLVTAPILAGYRYYRAKVTNSPSVPSYSNGVIIIGSAPSVAGTISGPATVCSGTNSSSLQLSGAVGAIIKWQSSTVANFSSNVTDIANTTSTQIITNATATKYYRVIVGSGICANDTSSAFNHTVNSVVANNTISGTQAVCASSVPSSLIGSVPTGGNGTVYTYSWLQSTTSANSGFTIASGVNNQKDYTPSALSQTTWYKRSVKSGVCATDTTAAINVTVNAIPSVGSVTSNSRCSSGTVTLGATASAGTLNWYATATGGTSLGTGTSFTTPSISSTTTYYVDATANGCTTATRSTVVATVNAVPTVSGTTPGSVCGTGTVTLGATASAGTLNWYAALTGGTSLGTGASFTTPSISSTTTYYVDATATGCTTATRSSVVATVNANITASVSVSASTTSVCGSNPITFTATPTNGGGSPTYQWKLNGVNVGTNSATYILNSPLANDTVRVVMTSNASPCLVNAQSNSTGILLTNSTITPSVSVSASPGNTACAGVNVTFTATPINGGATPTYQWKNKGINIGTNSNSYASNTLTSNDSIYVVLTSNANCISTPTATSNAVVMTINAIPTVSGTTPGSVCGTGTVTLGATSAGTLNWYAALTGGTSLGSGTSFTTPSISSTTTYYVDATANGCTTAARSAVVATVNAIPTVSGTTPGSVCGTGTVTLGATASAGTLNWYAAITGGTSLGTGTSFTTPSISSTTTYYVDATANGCTTAARSAVVATVNAIPTISGTTPAARCSTGTVTLGAAATAGSINWYNAASGGSVLGTGTTFTTPIITSTTTYYADATANGCSTANRSAVTATVNANIIASVSVSASTTSVCASNPITFTATPTNGGTTPIYQWKLNGVNVGTNSTTYILNAPLANDSVHVVMTSNATPCLVSVQSTSNFVRLTNSTVSPAVTITSNTGNTICAGGNITFTAVPNNGGTSPTYQWYRNGAAVGANLATYATTSLVNNDTIKVLLTSNASCLSTPTAMSNALTITVNATPSITTQPVLQRIVSGNTVQFSVLANNVVAYQWQTAPQTGAFINVPNGTVYTGGNTSTLLINNTNGLNNQRYRVLLTNVCGNTNSDSVSLFINGKPDAQNDTLFIAQGKLDSVAVLNNDVDIDGILSNPTIINAPLHGSSALTASGKITYQPTTGYYGYDTLTYRVCDNGNPVACDTAFVYIRINAAPNVANDTISVNEDDSVIINVRLNDNDPDGPLNNPVIRIQPNNGTVVINPNGTITFRPNPNFHGVDSFMYRVCDNGMPVLCDSAWVRLNINSINDRPDAVDDTANTGENTPVVINVRNNDSDIDGTLSNPIITRQPVNGTTTVNTNGTITYTPNALYNGVDSFMYRVCDNGMPVLCDSAWVRLNINSINDGPDAVDDTLTFNEDDSITVDLRLNDSDIDGTLNNPIIRTQPNNGTVVVNANGTITFRPNPNFHGVDSFMYRVCDNGLPVLCDSAWVRLNINPINDGPDAVDDSLTFNEDDSITVDLRLNDTDVDGTLNNPVIRTQPNNGTVVVNANGTITYRPNPNFHGVDSFMYRVCDNGLPVLCDSAWVRLGINPINDGPDALDDSLTFNEDDSITVDLRLNDSDVDGTLNNPVIRTQPNNGTVVVNANGTITFKPNPNFHGLDSFMYRVCDNGLPVLCDSAWVRLGINPINDGPDALDDTLTFNEDDSITVDLRLNDTDVDGTLNNPVIRTQPNNGTVVVNANGTITFKPNPNFHGLDSFIYQVCDNGLPVICDSAWVRLKINPINDGPDAIDDTLTLDEDGTITTDIRNNDIDLDGTLNNPTIINNPANGNVVVNANGSITYTPNPNYNGTDSFMYKICDNGMPVTCDSAWVRLNINSVNDGPLLINDTASTNKNTAVVVNVLVNDNDLDGTLNNPTIDVTALNGALLINANGTITYTPNLNFVGVDSFQYKACDNGLPISCGNAWVIITVKQVNDNNQPIAVNDTIVVKEGTSVVFNVTLNDTDDKGLGMPQVILAPKYGTLLLRADTTFIYTPNEGYFGPDDFTYRIGDLGTPALFDTAVVIIKVTENALKIPGGFSPDGDGVNDYFVIPGIEKYPNNVLRVINRWGEEVFVRQRYANDWGGEPNLGLRIQDGKLPGGTYFYIFETGTDEKPITGSIYINK
jgi:gliding motility-associated-like protein